MQEAIAIPLPAGITASSLLAMGGELKSSICIVQGSVARLSRPAGDLEQADELRGYRQQIDRLFSNPGFCPAAIAIDMHPDYLSCQYGRQLAAERGIELVPVQHHHAHIAACMAEHGLPAESKVLGIALDGLGYGADGGIWGAEFLLAGYADCERLGSFASIPMPGGAQAARQPWRNTLAHLYACGWDDMAERFGDTEIMRFLSGKPLPTLFAMLARNLNSPPASSAGRLFDAAAASVGIHRDQIEFEGQAAIMLEKLATSVWPQEADSYPFELLPDDDIIRIGWQPLWQALLADLQRGEPAAHIAARFHRTLIDAVTCLTLKLCHDRGLATVAISGGVFQNRLLREGVTHTLAAAGLTVLVPERIPAHDGGLAFGQACVAAARLG
ncbi:MAG TPA: hypothetical protein VNI58_10355 [Mariprofundaceae bacterium]|nr:hypothetical protein [Mariprofundaceae bacterium]